MAGPNSTISEHPPPDLSIASGFRRGRACVRRDDGRHAGDPDSGLARQAGDRPASTATDRRRDEVDGRDGVNGRATRRATAAVTTKRAFAFLVLTAARSGEVRLATWDEMDLDAGVWTIPGRGA